MLEDTTLMDVGVKALNPDVNLNLHRMHYINNHEPIRTGVPEQPRESWRLQLLREWSHEQVKQVFP